MTNVLHVITDLDMGGAEVMLAKLIASTDRNRFNPSVLSLKRRGVISHRIERLGVPVSELDFDHPHFSPQAIVKFTKTLFRSRPRLIQGWMYHGNLAATLMRFLNVGNASVIWNIRYSLNGLNQEKMVTRLFVRMGALLSGGPHAIIYNSHNSLEQHGAIGYFSRNALVIPNGFDEKRFRPDLPIRRRVRARLGVPEKGILIGLIARYNPMKDHPSFLKAASLLSKERNDVHFLLVGRNVDGPSSGLVPMVERLGLSDRVTCLGEQSDTAPFNMALDIASLSSAYGEGFPNVIGEAMSCAIPCVVTDVGDCRRLVGNTGIVVPPKDSGALKDGWDRMIQMGSVKRRRLGEAARNRILEHFTISKVAARYEDLYENILGKRKS